MSAERTDVRIEELAFLRALGEVMASDLRADVALARAVDLCFVRFELGALCAFRLEDGVFRLVAGHGLDPASRTRLSRIARHDLCEMLGSARAALSDEADTIAECTAQWESSEAVRPRSTLFAPLVYSRRRLGALLVVGHEGDTLGAAARATWDPIVNTMSVALRAADDFERVVALEAEKRQLVDNLPLIVARCDAKTGALVFINGAVQRVLGVRPFDALHSPALEHALEGATEREASRAARERARAGVHTTWEDRRYRHSDGHVLTLRECVYPVFDASRTVLAVEVIAYDITTEIDARREVMQADRLAALGALAAGVAHEINNPIAFITLAASQLHKLVGQVEHGDVKAAARLREVVREVGESADRIAEIVGELKLFTRIGDGSIACPVDVNRILQTALALTSSEIRRSARLDVSLGALPVAPGAFVNLGHAFVNLLMNAAQAVESKRARADLARESTGPNLVRVVTAMRDGCIVVCIEDTGIGIDERVLPRIFDPFFKTNTVGSGAGLGLAIAHDLVRRVGGEIRVESRSMKGTRFEVVLPLDAAESPSARAGERIPELRDVASRPDGGLLPRVLIIDDERALARALARQLSEAYDVDTASTARDALAQLRVRTYDVIVCDLRMPDRSGPQIYEQVRSHSSEQAARFVFTTGGAYGSMDDELHERADETGLPLLEKPFDGPSFEAVVGRVAARRWGERAPGRGLSTKA